MTYPGVYPLTNGSEVNELIAASGGLLESAYLKQAEITRVVSSGASEIEHIKFNLSDAMLGKPDANKLLQSKDSINIFAVPNWQENVKVELKGESKVPWCLHH